MHNQPLMMKKLSVLLLFAAALSSACSESDTDETAQPSPAPPLVETQRVDIDAAKDIQYSGAAPASELKLTVLSDTDWGLTVTDTRSAVDWITPASAYGKAGETTVCFTVSENDLPESRTAYIRLTNAVSSATFSYEQKHYDPAGLTLSVDRLSVGHEAVSKTFTLESALGWTIASSDESICTVTPIRGSAGTHTLTVAITGNTSTEKKRTATLTARSGYETSTLVVTQDRKSTVPDTDIGIKTLDDLCRFRDAVNEGASLAEWKYNGEINLLADIDLSYIDNWVPIGVNKAAPFTDVFNGNGFTLSNMSCTSISTTYKEEFGFFGFCMGGTIKNLHLERLYSLSNGLCGRMLPSKSTSPRIVNCSVSGYIAGSSICGNTAAYDDNPSRLPMYITDCTNKATCLTLIGYGAYDATVSSCIDQGFYVKSDIPKELETWNDCVDDGYQIPHTFFMKPAVQQLRNGDELINYIQTSLESFAFTDSEDYYFLAGQGKDFDTYSSNYYGDLPVNDKFVELISKSHSIKELHISYTPFSSKTGGNSVHKRILEIIDQFPSITLLEYGFGSYSTFYGNGLRNKKPLLETLIISETPKNYDPLGNAGIFPSLKRLIYNGFNPGRYLTPTIEHIEIQQTQDFTFTSVSSKCKELIIDGVSCNAINIDALTNLEYLECSGCKYLQGIDVSKTNFGNSPKNYPLKCLKCGSIEESFTITLKKGWEINGINKNRSSQYIDSYAIINYVD